MYLLTISGNDEIVAFLKAHLVCQWAGKGGLAQGRRAAEAINQLFGDRVNADVLSIERAVASPVRVKISE